jgi:hypothetical protein
METLVFALVMAASAAALSGCVTTQEMEARGAAKDGADCQDYGAVPGTSGYLQCRMLLRQQHIEQTAIAAAQSQHNSIRARRCSLPVCAAATEMKTRLVKPQSELASST